MDKIILIAPTIEHKDAAEEYKKEFFENGEEIINGSALLDKLE